MMAPTEEAKVPHLRDCLRDRQLGGFHTDGELLDRFVVASDEAAFEALMDRHGPMVLGVCRRILRNEADADDAFQATFMVLVRKASSIRPRSMVGNWLHGVAHNTALKARAMSTKRSTKEHEAAGRATPKVDEPTWEHLQPLLDQELKALPDKYRSAIILCDLEGNTLKEAARQLGCPLATVGTRLARGRAMLAQRLNRRRIVLSAGALALMLSQNAASAVVPAKLMESTAKAAALAKAKPSATGNVISAHVSALTAAMIKALLLARLKLAIFVLLVLATITVAGTWAAQAGMSLSARTVRKPKPDSVRLQHTWTLISVQVAGREVPKDAYRNQSELTFGAASVESSPPASWSTAYKIDPSRVRKEIDFKTAMPWLKGEVPPLHGAGIYKLEGNTLTICVSGADADLTIRPTEFVSLAGEPSTNLFVLERKRSETDRCGSMGKTSRHIDSR